MTCQSIWNVVDKIKDKCGIVERITPHSFRRAFATNLFIKGYSLLDISKKMGHASTKTTEHYILFH